MSTLEAHPYDLWLCAHAIFRIGAGCLLAVLTRAPVDLWRGLLEQDVVYSLADVGTGWALTDRMTGLFLNP